MKRDGNVLYGHWVAVGSWGMIEFKSSGNRKFLLVFEDENTWGKKCDKPWHVLVPFLHL
jgi:hypothetical protein